MQLTQTVSVGIVNDNGIGIGHIDTVFNDCSCDQHIIFVMNKIEDKPFQFCGRHTAMPHCYACIGDFTLYYAGDLFYIIYSVVDDKDLSVAGHLEIDSFPNNVGAESCQFGGNGIAIRRWGIDIREVACSHQREL